MYSRGLRTERVISYLSYGTYSINHLTCVPVGPFFADIRIVFYLEPYGFSVVMRNDESLSVWFRAMMSNV